MAEAEKEGRESKIKAWGRNLKAEFQKIVWLDRETVGKQTTAVVIVSVILALIIAILDALIKRGMDVLVNL